MDFCYLAGAIDQVTDGDTHSWHMVAINKLSAAGIIGISPLMTQAITSVYKNHIISGQPTNLTEGGKAIRTNGEFMSICKAAIFNLATGVPSVGVPQELFMAYVAKMPMRVVVIPEGVKSLYASEQATVVAHTLDDAIDLITDFYSDKYSASCKPCINPSIYIDPAGNIRNRPTIKVKKSVNVPIPSKAYDGDACYDIYVSEDTIVTSSEFTNVPAGISVELPIGWWMEIRARSSTSRKRNILIRDAVIDQGYRGELFVQAIAMSGEAQMVPAGERIAQFRISPIYECEFEEVDRLSPSERDTNGFGSSGL